MLKNRTLTTALGALVLLAGCSQSPEEKLADAQAYFAGNEYTAARLELTSALKDNPSDVVLLELLARTQLKLRDGEGTLAALERLSAEGVELGDASLLRAEAEVLRGRPEDALALLADMSSAEAARIRALALVADDRIDEAREAMKAGLEADGPKAALHADYALFALADGDRETAATYAASAYAEDPKALGALLAKAGVAIAEGKGAQALAHYETASKLYPESRDAMIGRIRQLAESGRVDEAAPLIEDAYAKAPQDVDFAFLAARLDVERGEWDDARSKLQRVERDMRDNPDGQLLYARTLLEAEQVALAESILRRLNARFPEHPGSAALLAEVFLSRGDNANARRVLVPVVAQAGAPDYVRDLALKAGIENAGRP
ncbi:tetratricopeptide repeat protein [Erythrobacter sp. HKB08]|uniref:tetratricopeptide repeat protein n=1 Tax=Erythrobacter sp. HKB08 TaxID=2502843 RepID=UPI0010093488|nr:tetratricopeptide repeat protein [Erythrobacter sp. HKB08]